MQAAYHGHLQAVEALLHVPSIDVRLHNMVYTFFFVSDILEYRVPVVVLYYAQISTLLKMLTHLSHEELVSFYCKYF